MSTSANRGSNHRLLRQIRFLLRLPREWFIKLFCVFYVFPPVDCDISIRYRSFDSSIVTMWPFFLDRTITFSKRMPATVAQVCDILLNADSFVRLNPYVIKVVQDPTNPQRYEIVDRLPGPGTWKYESSIHAIFTPMEDESGKGVDVAVTLPQSSRFLFPKMHNKYRVQETENAGIVQVTEVVRLRVSEVIRALRNYFQLTPHPSIRMSIGIIFARALHPQHSD